MRLSVLIPTHNRKEILSRCLKALFAQSIPISEYEIIVVDDGSTDGTDGLVKGLSKTAPVEVRYFWQPSKGPAAARNIGIRNAKGEIVLFTGDDIIATSTLLEEHLRHHHAHPAENIAVLGYVTWSPEIEITPFMKWLEESGIQFRYGEIKNKEDAGFQFFYTSNISLKRKFLIMNGIFDEDFPYASFEDIELAYRLQKKGLKMLYRREAQAYHYHFTSVESATERMKKVGCSAYILCQKHPGIKLFRIPIKIKIRLRKFLGIMYSMLRKLFISSKFVNLVYKYKMDEAFIEGYLERQGKVRVLIGK